MVVIHIHAKICFSTVLTVNSKITIVKKMFNYTYMYYCSSYYVEVNRYICYLTFSVEEHNNIDETY